MRTHSHPAGRRARVLHAQEEEEERQWALQAAREVQASVAERLEAACRLAAAGRPPAHIDGLVRTPAKSTCRLYHPPGPARQAASPPKSGNPSLPLPSPALPCPVTTHPPQRRSSPAERGPPDRQSGSAPYSVNKEERPHAKQVTTIKLRKPIRALMLDLGLFQFI